MKYHRAGQTWILSVRIGDTLFHLGSAYWWKPIVQFPIALWERYVRAPRSKESSHG